MAAREHAFSTVGGVPTHYARRPVATYGTIGVPRTFHATRAFYQKLDACFSELWRVSPEGRATAVVSAGAQVGKPGQHGSGRAIDIDAIFWPGRRFVTKEFPAQPQFYLSVEAVLRKHFGTVLNYHYNAAHQDHFHIDDGAGVGFRKVRSVTLFVQSVCYYIFGMRFRGNVDGKWGSATRAAVEEACQLLGVRTPLTMSYNWERFLDEVAGMSVMNLAGTQIEGKINRLVFDGRELTWFREGEKFKSWRAVSGRQGYQTKIYQKTKNKGPLPEGKWAVRQSEYQKMPTRNIMVELAAELGRTAWPGGASAWGKNRIWLKPLQGTATHGRSGFSIHGGDTPGSAGCIDLTTSMPEFTAEFLKFGKDLELEARYR